MHYECVPLHHLLTLGHVDRSIHISQQPGQLINQLDVWMSVGGVGEHRLVGGGDDQPLGPTDQHHLGHCEAAHADDHIYEVLHHLLARYVRMAEQPTSPPLDL